MVVVVVGTVPPGVVVWVVVSVVGAVPPGAVVLVVVVGVCVVVLVVGAVTTTVTSFPFPSFSEASLHIATATKEPAFLNA